MNNGKYIYDEKYYTLEELYEKYNKLASEQKQSFKDALSHFTLVGILKKSNYNEILINIVEELAQLEAAIIELYGSDCGNIALALRGQYDRDLKKLINLSGKLVSKDDSRIDIFKNGEELLNNLLDRTIGSSYEQDNIDDLCVINFGSLSFDDCLAISDNFMRTIKDEEMVSINVLKKIKK